MATTSTFTVAPIQTQGNLFYAWAHPIAAFLLSCGWVQQGDTGQVVWPVSIVNIASVANSGGVSEIYTYTLTNGPSLQVNSTIIIKGCTTAGLNGTFIITALGAGTFTTTNASAVTEAETANAAWGSVDERVTISNAVGNGTSNTYTFAAFDGVLVIGQSIVVSGCTTTGFNATFTIASINVGAGTFTTTATNAITHAGEAETGVGLVTCTFAVAQAGVSTTVTLPPAAASFVYEIWKMGDGNAFPVFMKIQYGCGAAATSPAIDITLCAGTDGAGNPIGGSTGAVVALLAVANSASTAACYLSGNTNRFQMCMWPGIASATIPGLANIERSHDASGNDTAGYATLSAISGSAPSSVQISITPTANTTTETKFPAMVVHGTGTGNFGNSTELSPVFPMVGAIGNPMYGLLLGKKVDWVDQTQFSFTLYNTAHNYIVFNNATNGTWDGAGGITYDSTPTCALMMRYE